MVELAAVLVIAWFAGYVINHFAKSYDTHRLGKRVNALIVRKEYLERTGGKGTEEYAQLDAEIDRQIHLMEIVENRDPNPLR